MRGRGRGREKKRSSILVFNKLMCAQEAGGRLLPLLWSIIVFCVTWPLITLLKDWLRVFVKVHQLPGPRGHPILGNAKEYLSRDSE